MKLTLLVLAAGMGSRYGGLKQLDEVGPSGETVMDYSVFDAMRAGFDRVVFVIRREIEEAFRAADWQARYRDEVPRTRTAVFLDERERLLFDQPGGRDCRVAWQLSGLTPEKVSILKNMVLLPVEGVETELFFDLTELEDFMLLDELIDSSFIQYNSV